MTAYRSPFWLPGGHTQTIYPLLIKPSPPPYRRERWETPDGDFIDLDWNDPSPATSASHSSPVLVLFHGLEGSSGSHYAISLMRAAVAIGWTGVVVNFRGCSGEINRLPRAYHSGDSAEIDWILQRLRQRFPQRLRYAVGVSLGGNALLKWLGERETAAGTCLQAAAAISAPLDLSASGTHLGRGFNRLYSRHFLHTLKRKAAAKLRLAARGSLRSTMSTRSGCARPTACTRSTTWSPRPCMASQAPKTTGDARRASPGSKASGCGHCCSMRATIPSCRRGCCPLPARRAPACSWSFRCRVATSVSLPATRRGDSTGCRNAFFIFFDTRSE